MPRPRILLATGILALIGCLSLGIGGAAAAKKHKPKPRFVTRTATAAANGRGQVASATAICPKKTKATGGGFNEGPLNPPANTPFVFESQKVDQRSWRVSAQADGSTVAGPSVSLTTFVYCSNRAPATTTASSTLATPGTPQNGPTVTVACQPGKVLGGGFATPPPVANPATNTTSNLVTSSRASGISGWQVGVRSQLASSVTGFAYCGKSKALREAAGTFNAAPNSNALVAVGRCAGKLKSLAGGFAAQSATGSLEVYQSNLQPPNNNEWSAQAVDLAALPFTSSLTSLAYCG